MPKRLTFPVITAVLAFNCVTGCDRGQDEYGGSGPNPNWILGKWATGDWGKREPMEVLEFHPDSTYVRFIRFDFPDSQAIGHFHVHGDKVVLHPEFFAVDAAHGGGKADRTLIVPQPRSRVLQSDKGNFYRVSP